MEHPPDMIEHQDEENEVSDPIMDDFQINSIRCVLGTFVAVGALMGEFRGLYFIS